MCTVLYKRQYYWNLEYIFSGQYIHETLRICGGIVSDCLDEIAQLISIFPKFWNFWTVQEFYLELEIFWAFVWVSMIDQTQMLVQGRNQEGLRVNPPPFFETPKLAIKQKSHDLKRYPKIGHDSWLRICCEFVIGTACDPIWDIFQNKSQKIIKIYEWEAIS